MQMPLVQISYVPQLNYYLYTFYRSEEGKNHSQEVKIFPEEILNEFILLDKIFRNLDYEYRTDETWIALAYVHYHPKMDEYVAKAKTLTHTDWGHGAIKIVGYPEPLPEKTASEVSRKLPGVSEFVKCPACSGEDAHTDVLREIIMELNDWCKWSREQIADWLDTLDIDLRFGVE